MEILVLDTSLKSIAIIDTFESLIWTDRYNSYGDIELFAPVSQYLLDNIKHDYYLWMKDTEYTMIVEDIEIRSDFDNGNRLVITGRSLESILDRRIVWKKTVLSGNLQNGIQTLLNENVISPEDTSRKIDNFIFEASVDPNVTSLDIDAQFTGEYIYDIIKGACNVHNIGFKVVLTEDNKFKFTLYSGTNRSYSQLTNSFVIFSPKFENIINSNYIESKKTMKNVTLVAGEEYDTTKDDMEAALDDLMSGGGTFVDVGAGVVRKTVTVASGGLSYSGLSRREMFSDAKDINQTVNEVKMSDAVYFSQLASRGNENLLDYQFIQSFEGEIESTHTFIYGVHYYLGDIVQVVNEYGIESSVRVTEVVRSQNSEGTTIHPTFSNI